MFRTANPTLNKDEFAPAQSWDDLSNLGGDQPQTAGQKPSVMSSLKSKHMTTEGTATKTFFLIAIVMAVCLIGWGPSIEMVPAGDGLMRAQVSGVGMGLLFGGMIGSLLVGLLCFFAPKTSPVTAPLASVFQGGFVCGISAIYASMFGAPVDSGGSTQGALDMALVLNAALLTFSIAGALCGAYIFKLVRPGRLFYTITIVGTLGVCLFGLVAFAGTLIAGRGSVFGDMISMYSPTNGSMISVGFSLLVVGLASMNLVLDFDVINNGVKNKAPKYMEWYGGYAILVTLVWLYVELLRLLAKLQSRD